MQQGLQRTAFVWRTLLIALVTWGCSFRWYPTVWLRAWISSLLSADLGKDHLQCVSELGGKHRTAEVEITCDHCILRCFYVMLNLHTAWEQHLSTWKSARRKLTHQHVYLSLNWQTESAPEPRGCKSPEASDIPSSHHKTACCFCQALLLVWEGFPPAYLFSTHI